MTWPTKKIREVCNLAESGVDFFDGKKEYIDTGSLINGNIISFETVTYEKKPSRANMEITAGDILVAKMKDTLKVYLTTSKDEKNRIFSTGFFVFKPKINLVISKYLFFYFISPIFQDLKNTLSHGATQKAINNQDIEKYFEIPLPPIEVQKKIVAKLESLLAKVSEAKKLRVEAQENTDNLLSAELYKIFEEGEKKGWEEKELSDVATFINGDRGKNYPNKNYREKEGVPFVNAGHITDYGLDMAKIDYISENRFNLLRSGKIKKGDILFCLRGSLGKTVIIRKIKKGAIASSLVIIRPTGSVDKEFLARYFLSPICDEQIDKYRSGAAQPNLSVKSLKKFSISVPSLSEQKEIVDRLDLISQKIQAVKELQNKTENEFDALEHSILSKAFSGNLLL